eukprot:2010113-Amphidinium_carterae.1
MGGAWTMSEEKAKATLVFFPVLTNELLLCASPSWSKLQATLPEVSPPFQEELSHGDFHKDVLFVAFNVVVCNGCFNGTTEVQTAS